MYSSAAFLHSDVVECSRKTPSPPLGVHIHVAILLHMEVVLWHNDGLVGVVEVNGRKVGLNPMCLRRLSTLNFAIPLSFHCCLHYSL